MTLSWANALFAGGLGVLVGGFILVVGLGIDAFRDRRDRRTVEEPQEGADARAIRGAAKEFDRFRKAFQAPVPKQRKEDGRG